MEDFVSQKLARHLKLHTPILGITSDEAIPVIDDLAENSDRVLFRMDVLEGMLTFQDGKWLRVLGPDPEDANLLSPISDFGEAMSYCLDNRGVMIIENAHQKVEPLIGFLNHISEKWYRAFSTDNVDKMPISLVLISNESKVPEEIKRTVVQYSYPLPTEADIDKLLVDLTNKSDLININADERRLITRAAVGMSQYEFLHTAANSLVENGTIDPEIINGAKVAILAKDGVLTMRVPKTTMADIGGMDNAKHIMQRTTWIWNHPEEAKKLHIEPLRRILLVGVPGTGKSALCEATASELGLDLAKFGVGAMMNKFIGESEANMRRAFIQIETMAPLCLWIDELGRDFSGGQSSGSVDGGTTDRVHGELLSGLQDLPDNVFLVCAANRIDDLPPEMLRADRFDKILFVGFPTQKERVEIFKIHFGPDFYQNYDIESLATCTPNFTGAEIKALIKEARFEISAIEHRPPTTEEIISIAANFKGRVWNNHRPAIQEMYRKALTEWDWASNDQFMEAQQGVEPPVAKPVERKISALSDSGSFFKK